MTNKKLVSILIDAIEARKKYINAFYVEASATAMAILGIFVPPFLFLSIIAMLIGLFMSIISLSEHIQVIKAIKKHTDSDPYTPFKYAVILELISLFVLLFLYFFSHLYIQKMYLTSPDF